MTKGRWILLIVGIVILGFSIAIMSANREGRAAEIGNELIETTEVLPENEGKLVIVSGIPTLSDGGVIADKEAGLQVENAVYYSRVPYQKVYEEEERKVIVDEGEDKYSPVDDVVEYEYYVVKTWIPASADREAVIVNSGTKYENPPAVNMKSLYASGALSIGSFRVSPADVSDYLVREERGFTPDELLESCGEYVRNSGIDFWVDENQYGDGMLSNGDDIGSVHVVFSYETLEGAKPVTVIGRQRGNQLVLEEDGPVSEAEQVQAGLISKEQFLASITAEDASSRTIGVVGIVLGAVLSVFAVGGEKLLGAIKRPAGKARR